MANGADAGTDEDETRIGGSTQQGQEGLSHADDADDIDGEDLPQRVSRHGVLAEDARVVDQDVESSVRRLDSFGRRVDRVVVRHVDLDRTHAAFDIRQRLQRRRGFTALLRVSTPQQDVVVGRGEKEVLGGLIADALIRA